ncbi:MAG TPA: hypothetical protein EYH56_03200 [Nanoarchaeota archaeon]|nr:hypothetical protein [Nanoarchaeota archaeon]
MTKKKSIGKKLKKFSIESRLKIAEEFKKKVLEKFGDFIKTIIIWGSVTRGDLTAKSDVDIYIIFDDTKYSLKDFNKIRDKIDEDLYEIAKKIDKRIHIQPIIALTEFIDGLRNSHPLFINIVREGFAIYDTGFFIPMRKLLEWGKFPLTKEAAITRIEGVEDYIERAKRMKAKIVAVDVYHTILDSVQGLLMYLGITPPAPKLTAEYVRNHLVKPGLLEEKDAELVEKVVKFYKAVDHGEIKEISGNELDEWIKKAEEFYKKVRKIFLTLDIKQKEKDVKEAYEFMIKSIVAYLSSINKLPDDPKKLPEAFEKEIIEKGIAPEFYREVFRKIIEMRKLVEEKKFSEISDKELNLMKEYIRRFGIRIKELLVKNEESNKTNEKEK